MNRNHTTRTTALGALVACTLALPSVTSAQQTLNATGGTSATDGLRIAVAPNSQIQVHRASVGQVYEPGTLPPTSSMFNGFYVAVDTTVYGPDAGPLPATTDVLWTEVSQTPVTGTGTSLDLYEVRR